MALLRFGLGLVRSLLTLRRRLPPRARPVSTGAAAGAGAAEVPGSGTEEEDAARDLRAQLPAVND